MMIKIIYGPVTCRIEGSGKEFRDLSRALDAELSFWVSGFIFSPKYQSGLWDGKHHLYSKTTHTFPSGLLFKVLNICREENWEVEVEGYPEPFENVFDSVELMGGVQLRDYQLDPIRKILKYHRGVWEVATNGGKTETAAGLLKLLGHPPCIFLIPRQVLLRQTADRLKERLGKHVSMMGAGKQEFDPNGINVCMFQTLQKKLKNKAFKKSLASIKVVFADECHLLLGDGYQTCFESIPAEYRVGMSGTPFHDDILKKSIMLGLVGPVVGKVDNAELMNMGYSVRPSVAVLDLNIHVDTKSAEYGDSAWRTSLETHPLRNEVISKMARGLEESGRQTIVMVATVEHGSRLSAMLPKAMFVHANSPGRKEAVEKLARGDIFTLICTPIFDTGLSVDHIEGLILASGGESHIKLLQSIGRAIRVSKTKQKDVWVLDFTDKFNKITASHARKRKKVCINQKAFNMVLDWAEIPAEICKYLNGTELKSKKRSTSPRLPM